MGFDFDKMKHSYLDQGAVVKTHLGIHEAIPFAFNPDETIKGATVDQNIIAMKAGGDQGLKDMLDVIAGHDDLKASFGRLCANEGGNIEQFGKLFEAGGTALDPKAFKEMMDDPTKRDIVVKMFDAAATPEIGMDKLISTTKASMAFSQDPMNAENRDAFLAEAKGMGMDTAELEKQTSLDFGQIFEDPKGFMKKISGMMGLSGEQGKAFNGIFEAIGAFLEMILGGEGGIREFTHKYAPAMQKTFEDLTGVTDEKIAKGELTVGEAGGTNVQAKGDTSFDSAGGTQLAKASIGKPFGVATGELEREDEPTVAAQEFNNRTPRVGGLGMGGGN